MNKQLKLEVAELNMLNTGVLIVLRLTYFLIYFV
jgi:hypothetical protein